MKHITFKWKISNQRLCRLLDATMMDVINMNFRFSMLLTKTRYYAPKITFQSSKSPCAWLHVWLNISLNGGSRNCLTGFSLLIVDERPQLELIRTSRTKSSTTSLQEPLKSANLPYAYFIIWLTLPKSGSIWNRLAAEPCLSQDGAFFFIVLWGKLFFLPDFAIFWRW